jgi:cytochrome d ubiquinol oxidase subunit II
MQLTWTYLAPLIFMAVMGLALLTYVVLDGYDLGVGMLLPFATDEKDVMVSSIGPFWDANETWLVLGVGVLLVAFPAAHGVVLQALYLPVAVMLIGLVLRGVAFDFRVKAHADHKALWNRLFASRLTACHRLAQGWMLGSYLTGFDNGVWSLLFSTGIALTLPTAYAMLGAGWLIMKTDGALQGKAVAWASQVFWPMAGALVAISLATPVVSQTVYAKWFHLPQLFALLPIPLICAGAMGALHHVVKRPAVVKAGYGWVVFASTVAVFVLAFFGLAYSLYPYIVIDRLNVWEAASSPQALAILMVGVGITLPAIIGYTIFMYRVFWGKARELTYGL